MKESTTLGIPDSDLVEAAATAKSSGMKASRFDPDELDGYMIRAVFDKLLEAQSPGNKSTLWLTAVRFIDKHGLEIDAASCDVYDLE